LTKVVVVGGENSLVRFSKVEVVDISGSGKVCPTLPDYPFAVESSSVSFYNGRVIVCVEA